MSKNADAVPIGKVIGVHGIRGEIKFKPFGALEDLLDIPLETVFITDGATRRELTVVSARPHKGGYIMAIKGVTDREGAERLAGLEVSIARSVLPRLPKGEYYHLELMGMEVFTDTGRFLGRITGIIQTGSNDVFEVMGEDGEVLIPATAETMIGVDVEEKKVTVRLMEGLLPGEQ